MKKILVVLTACCLTLSSCLNITEELFLENDGSGTYTTTVKMDKLQELMEMVKSFAPDSIKNDQSLGSLQDSLQMVMSELSNVPGISEIRSEKPDSSSFTVSFRFKDVQALNAALKKRNKGNLNTGDIFTYAKGSFSCNDKSVGGMSSLMDNAALGNNDPNATGTEQAIDPEQAKGMIKMLGLNMTMKTIYHFPGKVKNFTNKMAQLSPDGKTLTLELDLLDDNKDKTLENKIEFR